MSQKCHTEKEKQSIACGVPGSIAKAVPALGYVYDELLKGRAHELLHIHYPLHGQH